MNVTTQHDTAAGRWAAFSLLCSPTSLPTALSCPQHRVGPYKVSQLQHCWQLWHLLYGNVCSGVPTFLTNAPFEPLLVPNDHALGSSGRKSSVNEPETCFYPWGRITWWKQGCLFLKVQGVPWLSLGVLHRSLCNCWKEISLNRSDKTVGTFTGENKQTDLKSCRTGKAYHISYISSTYFT